MSSVDTETLQEDLAEMPLEKRAYPLGSVADRPQGPRSPGPTEPGDMGAFDKEYDEPQNESKRGNGDTRYRGA